jgi:tetratricopeptide (TPR) repeat protein
MINPIEVALRNARDRRKEGRKREAERFYVEAAELARSEGDQTALAHALRHLSDLARARGASAKASQNASEAVVLYRQSGDTLGLANAIRLKALSVDDPQEAQACWQEARDLYSRLGVDAGVAECESHLKG